MQMQPCVQDEEQSQLNVLMAQKIRSGAFGHISLFATRLKSTSCLPCEPRAKEVNNVCDHGLEMVAALRLHLERSLTMGPISTIVV